MYWSKIIYFARVSELFFVSECARRGWFWMLQVRLRKSRNIDKNTIHPLPLKQSLYHLRIYSYVEDLSHPILFLFSFLYLPPFFSVSAHLWILIFFSHLFSCHTSLYRPNYNVFFSFFFYHIINPPVVITLLTYNCINIFKINLILRPSERKILTRP